MSRLTIATLRDKLAAAIAERDAARAELADVERLYLERGERNKALRAERDAARAVLREVEWSSRTVDGLHRCPVCWVLKLHSPAHAPDCALAAAKGGER